MMASGTMSEPRRALPPPGKGYRRIASSVSQGSEITGLVESQSKGYTIPAHRPFLATLASGLLRMAGADSLGMARITVLLPTRRGGRPRPAALPAEVAR